MPVVFESAICNSQLGAPMAEHRPDRNFGASKPLASPLYPSSVYTLPDLDALDRIMDGEESGFIYARDGHPNARQLAAKLAELEGGKWGVVCGSGMASITAIVLSLVQGGDHIVASNRLYGRTSQLFMQELPRFGVHTTPVDCHDLDEVRRALQTPARVLYVETMSNPLLRVPDLERVAVLAHDYECRMVVDNTFATPVLARPLELGADVVMESLTKMIGGHSDLTLGFACAKEEDLLPQITQVMSIWGLSSNPFDCWLAERGLTTLPLRMRTASYNAAALAQWLLNQRGVSRVVYPGLPDHPDHHHAASMLDGYFGNMLCFELEEGRDAVNYFLKHAVGIPFSPSLGNTTTTCSHPATTSHRFVSAAEKQRQGITDGLIRLSVGVEELEEIQYEMAKGL
jgi:cystathionine beta-lyase/cystathionine gamma-synthase